jgi:hypothetical protein
MVVFAEIVERRFDRRPADESKSGLIGPFESVHGFGSFAACGMYRRQIPL